jgi:hypothetical protein
VEDIRQWEINNHRDVVFVEITAKLPRGDEYTVESFQNCWVTNLGFRKDFADEVDRPLHTEGMAFLLALHHDCGAGDVSSRGDV